MTKSSPPEIIETNSYLTNLYISETYIYIYIYQSTKPVIRLCKKLVLYGTLTINPKSPFIWFDLVHWPLYFIDFLIRRHHISSLLIMPRIYNYCWCITSFKSRLRKKETRMFYVANIITCIVFFELLWISTLIVHYKLNRFRTPLNQFEICALSFGG